MEKIYGTKQRQDCLVRTGRSKWILFFGFWKDDEKSESGWEYRHTFNRKPTLSEVKEIVVSAPSDDQISSCFHLQAVLDRVFPMLLW